MYVVDLAILHSYMRVVDLRAVTINKETSLKLSMELFRYCFYPNVETEELDAFL